MNRTAVPTPQSPTLYLIAHVVITGVSSSDAASPAFSTALGLAVSAVTAVPVGDTQVVGVASTSANGTTQATAIIHIATHNRLAAIVIAALASPTGANTFAHAMKCLGYPTAAVAATPTVADTTPTSAPSPVTPINTKIGAIVGG